MVNVKKNSDIAAVDCDGTFDLIFVDGDRTYDAVKKDLELYWPKVKSGGILVGHGYTVQFPEVIQAVKEWGIPYSAFYGTSLFYARKN